MPERIQCRRTKGWRMPADTIRVCRPSIFGNPFPVEHFGRVEAVHLYEAWLAGVGAEVPHGATVSRTEVLRAIPTLRGKDLACFCPLDRRCHSDVLLRLANEALPASPEPSRPLLRYHGGKWLLAPWIISHFPQHRTYVEPFAGAASILLRKPRSFSEIYNDLDGEVVNVFQVARDHGSELVRALDLTPFSRVEFEQSYQPVEDPIERARRTIIRSFQGFGSDGVHSSHRTGFRGRSQRAGTTPAHDWRNYPVALRNLIERLQGVVIEQKPALEIIRKYDGPGVLHYIDPPYVHTTRCRVDAGRGYRHEMTDEDHRELAAVLNEARGAVVLSGYPSDLYEDLYAGWQRIERPSFADGARSRTEVLWLRNVVATAPELQFTTDHAA